MRRLFTAINILCFGAFLAAGIGRAAAADDSSWKSQLHLSQATEIPGKVLEPGDYVVKVLDTKQPRKIVQFSNADDTKVIATVMAIPDYRVQPAERVEFTYFQRGSNAPQALKEWFYVGNNYGIEFVYNKPAAYEIAKNNNENVIMTQTENNTEEIKEVTPEQKEVTYESKNVEPAAPAPAAPAPTELPKTGSDLPSVALAGAILLAGAATLRLARRLNA